MSTFELAFIVPITVDGQQVRKLVFAPKGVQKDDPSYFRASLLAGPWRKQTRICKGTVDGVAITSPVTLPLRLTQSKDRGTDMLVPIGSSMTVTDPTIEPVVDAAGKPVIGKDEKPIFNIRGGAIAITTYVLSSGDDDAAFATAPKAPAAPTANDDEAFV